jgi:hypothetical protein
MEDLKHNETYHRFEDLRIMLTIMLIDLIVFIIFIIFLYKDAINIIILKLLSVGGVIVLLFTLSLVAVIMLDKKE